MRPAEALAAVRDADRALCGGDPKPFPLPIGELAPVVAGVVSSLGAEDWWLPSLRERIGATVREAPMGVPLERLLDGRLGARPYRLVPAGGSPALRALLAVGIAHAERDRTDGARRWAVVHLGIGSASDGALHEALNLAALLRPNVIFVVSCHPLDGDAPLGRQLASTPAALARAFEIATSTVDGADADAVASAVRAARGGSGPHLIEATLARRAPASGIGTVEEST